MVLVSIISSGALAPCTNSVTTALEISGLGNDSTTVPARFASWASDDTHSSARWATACRRSGFASKPTRGILPDSAEANDTDGGLHNTLLTLVHVVAHVTATSLGVASACGNQNLMSMERYSAIA